MSVLRVLCCFGLWVYFGCCFVITGGSFLSVLINMCLFVYLLLTFFFVYGMIKQASILFRSLRANRAFSPVVIRRSMGIRGKHKLKLFFLMKSCFCLCLFAKQQNKFAQNTSHIICCVQ